MVIIYSVYARTYFIGIALIPAAVLVFSRTSKVKDSEYDAMTKKIAADNGIPITGEYVVHEYDLDAQPVKIGSDQRARSAKYVVGKFEFSNKKCVLTRWEIDVINASVSSDTHELGEGDQMMLLSEEREINGKKRPFAHIALSGAHNFTIPVAARSTDGDSIVERFGRM